MSYPHSTSCGEIGLILHIILDNIIEYKEDGVFVEVGANDGKTGSFTYNLAKIGWTGINIEPVPRLYKECVENHRDHKNVININCGIGEKNEELEIYDAGTLSTIDEETYKNYKTIGQFQNMCKENDKHLVKVRIMDEVLKEEKIENIDVVVVDVEGYEEKVLSGFSIEDYSPKILIIEIGDQYEEFIKNENIREKFKRLRKYFKEKNYSLLVNDIVDNVYVRNDIYSELNNNFKTGIRKLVKYAQFDDSKI
jgi:FkbM family methyltransferase|uniref:Methyltransferase FkbM domain-containing protein n=1 Tax=viral metagenome TaxID=1070528 RepID=A0A6C0IML3_9ZZZZ